MVDKHVRLLISGRVQGVYYRESTRREAQRLGVSGWVRNLPDGRVEAMLHGAGDAVDQLVAWCRHGPPAAAVSDLQLEAADPDPGAPGFAVRRTP